MSSNCSICSKRLKSIIFKAFHKNKKYTFYRCTNCDLIQIRPLIIQSPNRFYSYEDPNELIKAKNHQVNALLHIPFGKTVYRTYLDSCFSSRYNKILALHVSGKILDIGCGDGSFLEKFAGNKWQLTGIEINRNLAKQAKLKLKKANILTQPVQHIKLTEQSFEIITMWHVLEHLPNPKIVLNSLSNLISPDGYLVIEVPNGNSIYRKLFRAHWQLLLLPQHLFFWTKKSLTLVLNEAGFQTTFISYPGILSFSGSSSFANLFRSKRVNSFVAILAAYLLFPITLLINLFSFAFRDNMLIIAKPVKK